MSRTDCPLCGAKKSVDLLATTNKWKYYCISCKTRFDEKGLILPKGESER